MREGLKGVLRVVRRTSAMSEGKNSVVIEIWMGGGGSAHL